MLADGRLDVAPLITHRFRLEDAARAYEVVGGAEPSLGILLEYTGPEEQADEALRRQTVALAPAGTTRASGRARVSFIGSGNYATGVLIPAFKAAGAELRTVASSGGVSGVHAAKKFGFGQTTTDAASVLADPTVNTVVVTTRHDSHARFVLQALAAGKQVFVEKPLCLTRDELAEIEAAMVGFRREGAPPTGLGVSGAGSGAPAAMDRPNGLTPGPPLLVVGFNRRFSPLVVKANALLAGVSEPKALVMTVNAGAIPPEHWTQDRAVGGGRIVGEACHFVDLLRHLVGHPIVATQAVALGRSPGMAVSDDKVSIGLRFADGSIGTVHYLANGHKSFPKERLEIFAAGRVLQLDNFRVLRGYGWPGFRDLKLWRQDKGQKALAAAFVKAVETGGPPPIPFDELFEVTRVTLDIDAQVHAVL